MVGIAIIGFRVGGYGPLFGGVLLGMGIGAEIDLIAYILSRYFGLRAFGALHGIAFCFAQLASASGGILLGWCYQLRHSYGPGLILMEVLLVIAIIILAGQGAYKYPAIKAAQRAKDMAHAH
jgi:MFS family permease